MLCVHPKRAHLHLDVGNQFCEFISKWRSLEMRNVNIYICWVGAHFSVDKHARVVPIYNYHSATADGKFLKYIVYVAGRLSLGSRSKSSDLSRCLQPCCIALKNRSGVRENFWRRQSGLFGKGWPCPQLRNWFYSVVEFMFLIHFLVERTTYQ